MPKGYEVTAPVLNIRSGPGTQYQDIGDLRRGDILVAPVGWVPVVMDDESIGWVSAEFVREVELEDEGQTPVPKPPPSGQVIYQNQLLSLFGTPHDPAPYLKVMDFMEFRSAMGPIIDYLGNKWGFRIYGHELLEAPMRQAFRNLIDRGHSAEWRTYEGCLNIRPMTGGNGYSTHAWGLAIDLNASENRYGAEPSLSAGFVECFEDAGFTWGGRWRTRDGMHFQIPRIG